MAGNRKARAMKHGPFVALRTFHWALTSVISESRVYIRLWRAVAALASLSDVLSTIVMRCREGLSADGRRTLGSVPCGTCRGRECLMTIRTRPFDVRDLSLDIR